MSATPIIYDSTDASAPVIDGQNGSLITALRAILVSGYGAKAAAGWSEPFTAAGNIAVFRNNSVVGNGTYMRIDDSGSTAATGKTAVVRNYSAMTDLSTGTNPYPSVAQESVGLYIRKSEAATSTARQWWAIACRKWIYLFIASNSEGLSLAAPYFSGDFKSDRAGDAYNSMLTAGDTVDPTTSALRSKLFAGVSSLSAAPSASSQRCYIAGAYTQVAASLIGAIFHVANTATVGSNSATFTYPTPVANGLRFSALLVMEAASSVRGEMPNVVGSWHNRALSDLTSRSNVPAAGLTAISKLFCGSAALSASNAGEVLFDTTSTG